MEIKDNMIEKKSWEEFRDVGMIWFVNRILHVFGWAITYETEDKDGEGMIKKVYPARCKFRGFCYNVEEKGFRKVTEYMKENIDDLTSEI